MKINFNVMSKTALSALIASAAIVPAIAVPTASAATAPVTDVVYDVNGQNTSIGFDTFSEAINAEALTDLDVKYVKAGNGKFYTFADFSEAANAFDTPEEALTALAASNKDVTVSNVVEGTIDPSTGGIVAPEAPVEDFEVTDIAAINETSVTVTLKDTPSEAPKAADFKLTVGGESIAITDVTADASDLTGKTFVLKADLAGKAGVVAVNGTDGASVDYVAPTVESAKATSNTKIKVVFNTEVDKTSAETATNYVANNNMNILEAELQADKKTVVLTTSAQSALVNYDLTISNVAKPSGAKIETTVKSVAGSEAPELVNILDNSNTEIDGSVTRQDTGKFTIDYNVAIESTTVTTQSVKLYNVTDKVYVPGTVNVNTGTGNIEFIPTAGALDNNKSYRFEVASTVASTNGYDLGENKTYEFIVGQAATATIVNPGPGAAVNTDVKVQFNAPIDASSLTKDAIVLEELDELNNVVGTVSGEITYDAARRTATFAPATDLKGETTYQAKVNKNIIKSANGVMISTVPAAAKFTTAVSDAPKVDKVTIGSNVVENGVKDIATASTPILVEFDQNLTSDSVNPQNVSLFNVTTGEYETGLTVNNTANANVVSISGHSLNSSSTYRVEMNGLVADNKNQTLVPAYNFEFSTVVVAPVVDEVQIGGAEFEEGSTNIVPNSAFTIKFKDDIDVNTVNNKSSVKVYNVTDSKFVTTGTAPTASGDTITVPADKFVANKKYKVIVEKTVTDDTAEKNPLPTKLEYTFTTGDATTGNGPVLANNKATVTLADGTTTRDLDAYTLSTDRLALDKAISLEFTKDVDTSTLNKSNLQLVKSSDNTVVDATYAVDGTDGKKVVIKPKAELEQGTVYKVVVKDGLLDKVGNKATAFTSKVFQTKSVLSYTSSIANDATNVDGSNGVVLTFNNPMNATTLNNTNVVLEKYTSGSWSAVSGPAPTLTYDVNTKKLTIASGELLDNTSYRVKLNETAIKDAQGNVLGTDAAKIVTTFKTAADTTAPELVSAKIDGTTKDLNGAKEVSTTADALFTFSEAIDAGSLTTGDVTITDLSAGGVPVSLTGTKASYLTAGSNAKEVKVVFNETGGTTTSVLDVSKNYRVVVSGLEDAAGNKIAPVISTFITGPKPVATYGTVGTIKSNAKANIPVDAEQTIVFDGGTGITSTNPFKAVSANDVVVYKDGQAVTIAGLKAVTAADGQSIKVTLPKNTLSKDASYVVELKDTVEDKAGNNIAKVEADFTTAGDDLVQTPAKITIKAGTDVITDQTVDVVDASYDAGINFVLSGTANIADTAANKQALASMIEIKDISDSSAVKSFNFLNGDLAIAGQTVTLTGQAAAFFEAGNTYTITLKAGTLKTDDNKTITITADKKITVRVAS